jgi:hypothetical protein
MSRIYRNAHIQQKLRTSSGALYGCTDSCGAMWADSVTLGGVRITEAGFRKMSPEPIPDPASPGLNIPQFIATLQKLRIAALDKSGETWTDLMKYLDGDRRVMLQLDYWTLNDCGRAHVGHAVFLQAHRTITLKDGRKASRILADNPACSVGKWYPPSQLRAAAEAFGDSTGVPGAGIRFAVSRIVPRMAT